MTGDLEALLAEHPAPWQVMHVPTQGWTVFDGRAQPVAWCDEKEAALLIAGLRNQVG